MDDVVEPLASAGNEDQLSALILLFHVMPADCICYPLAAVVVCVVHLLLVL